MELQKNRYEHFTPEEIHPRGWLAEQLRTQAEGLAGNLDLFWPDVKDSAWIGGKGEGWERLPYWLDGFLLLAWLLDDEALKNRASQYVDRILTAQQPDGWICPVADKASRAGYDLWAYILILRVLIQYEECTGDERIEPAVIKALFCLDRHIDSAPLSRWAQSRWFEALYPLYWCWERNPQPWMGQLFRKLRAQGFDWETFFEEDWPYEKLDRNSDHWSYAGHVVNNAMMLRSCALLWKQDNQEEHLHRLAEMQKQLDNSHGQIHGMFSGDECLAGTSPVRGTELCAVVEYLSSLESIIEITGDYTWTDRLERVAFNALPAAISPDMWTHQYDQQVNQMQCTKSAHPVFQTNGSESNLFGLEPNYGCCTANFGQGWPKFARSLSMKNDQGITLLSYVPHMLQTRIKDIPVTLTVNGNYPFENEFTLQVEVKKEVSFTLSLRIPDWAEATTVHVGDILYTPARGTLLELTGSWLGTTEIWGHFSTSYLLHRRPRNLYALTKGALVFAMPIDERWEEVNQGLPGHEAPHCDYEVLPDGKWNFGFSFPDKNNIRHQVSEQFLGIKKYPFSPQTPPIEAYVTVREVDWEIIDGSAAPAPSFNSKRTKEILRRFIPYGCTNLRMTELPVLR